MARRKKWVRTTPTPAEAARFQALKLKGCPGCYRIRFASYFGKDGQCLECNGDHIDEAKVLDDRLFLKRFKKQYLGGR